jgi:hypothetical protein
MTAQVPDDLNYQGTGYAITAVDGSGLFDPSLHGLVPKPLSTACWRGFTCSYLVDRSRLVLTRLDVGLADDDDKPELLGIVPQPAPAGSMHRTATVYQPLAVPVAFTGRLLIGADWIAGIYLHMGFQPAWRYERVHELAFTGGHLESTVDRSAQVAEVRERLGEAGARPRDGEAVKDWIHRTFSLTFDYSWPDQH